MKKYLFLFLAFLLVFGGVSFSQVSRSDHGMGAGVFDGTGDYLSTPDAADLKLGTGNFTVEADVVFTSNPAASQYIISKVLDGNNFWGLQKIDPASGNKLRFISYRSSSQVGTYIMTNNWSVSLNTKYHIAFEKTASNAAQLTINGVVHPLTATVAFSAASNYDFAGQLDVGDFAPGAGTNFFGYLKNIRISKGIARYSSTQFPPPRKYYSDSFTSLLLSINDQSNGSTTFVDSSSNAHTMTSAGDAKISTARAVINLFKKSRRIIGS